MLRTIVSKDMSMSRTAPGPNPQILEEASAWFVTFRSQDFTADTARDFHDWLKRSPEHIRAYLEIAAIYADIPAPEQGRTPAELIARAKCSPDLNVIPLNLDSVARERLPQAAGAPRSFATRFALAASILIGAFVGTWLYTDRNTYGTGIGEQRSITLEDGSIVELNARSKVRIALDERQRDIHLLEGQALFRVAKDHQRPFVVHAGTASVRAVGTQFDVNRKSASTTVTVLEGRVAVLSAAPGQAVVTEPAESSVTAPGILLVSGEQMTVTPGNVRKAESPDVAAATAWTQHLLVFDGTALSEVLEEFSRHTRRRIVVDSPELAALKISGQYTSTNPDSLLRFLSLQEGVIVSEVNDEIHIRKE
jgi:transmembrane sensor